MRYKASSNHEWILTLRGNRGDNTQLNFILVLDENYAFLDYYHYFLGNNP